VEISAVRRGRGEKIVSDNSTGFVRVLENLESHGISIFKNPGLEILENQF
jgi:hypothetical protein